MEHFLIFMYMIALLVGTWAAFAIFQNYKIYRLPLLKHYLYYTLFFNLALFFYQISAYILINVLGSGPEHIPALMRIVIMLTGFVLEAGMTFNLVRTSLGLAGKERVKPVNAGLITLFLLFCISYAIGLTIYIQNRILNWLNTTYMVMYFSVFLIVFSALLVTAFSRLPENQRAKKGAIGMFVILYIMKYGLLAFEPVWGKPFGMVSGALLLILANIVPIYWLRIWFVKQYADVYDEDTRRKLTALVQNYGISNRELEIIELILKGKSNKEIEDMLFISFSTVKNHIYNIYQKMGINSRGQLMAMVINHPKENN